MACSRSSVGSALGYRSKGPVLKSGRSTRSGLRINRRPECTWTTYEFIKSEYKIRMGHLKQVVNVKLPAEEGNRKPPLFISFPCPKITSQK